MKLDFSALNKQTAKSFNEQKALIKKVMAGRVINCETCNQPLKLLPPESHEKAGVACDKKCTFIELDFC